MSGRKKSFIKWNFFALLSRNLVGRTKCLKKAVKEKVYGKNQLWKKQTTFICYCWLTYYIFLLEKKIEKKKTKKNYNKYTWSHLLKTCLMNKMMMKWNIIFTKKFRENDFTKKNAKKISLLMSKTMRKKKMKRYVQNLPYMHHDENSFRKSQISVTHSLAFQDILKLLLYCYRYTTTTILFKLQLHNIITTILWIVKKSIFQSFCYCFSAPL